MTIRELLTVFSAFGLLQIPAEAQEIPRLEITVQRLVIDAHVVSDSGDAIADLRPRDFIVDIDGARAEVEDVEWIPAVSAQQRSRQAETLAEDDDTPRGRVLVLFFQTDFQRFRAGGQMKMIPYAERLVERLGPDDLVAVVSHDSHLKVRQDFTTDHARIRKAIHQALQIDDPLTEPADGPIALLDHLRLVDARDAATPERAIDVVAQALRPIEGPKSILLFGWGLGVYTSFGVIMNHDYDGARRSLDEARTTVFSIDISESEQHSLEFGLQQTAKDSGGMYMKTNTFAQMAVDRVEKAISGRYEIVVKTSVNRGLHRVDVKLASRKGTVLARRSYTTH